MLVFFLPFYFAAIELIIAVIIVHAVPIALDTKVGKLKIFISLNTNIVMGLMDVNLVFYITLHKIFNRVLQMGTVLVHGHL